MAEGFITVREPCETECEIKKSRFITKVYPIESEEEAAEITAKVKKEHYKATHVCSAWVLNTVPEKMKALDDGEPGGTAGRPMLEVILNREVKNVLVLVIRYFGGIKLGAGGLVRAYSGCCRDGLDAACLVREEMTRRVHIETEYSLYQGLVNELSARGLKPVEENFTDMVELVFEIPDGLEEKLIARVQDYTNDEFLANVEEAVLMQREIDPQPLDL